MQTILVQCNNYLMFYYNTIAQMKCLEMKWIKTFSFFNNELFNIP